MLRFQLPHARGSNCWLYDDVDGNRVLKPGQLDCSIVFTTLLAASQGSADRDRAKIYGVLLHLAVGLVFAFGYLFAFHAWHGAAGWKGLMLGAVQGAFFLTFGVTLLPSPHPRMASEHEGPTVVRKLEPPGFLGLNSGARTPISIFVAHLVWGALLGEALIAG